MLQKFRYFFKILVFTALAAGLMDSFGLPAFASGASAPASVSKSKKRKKTSRRRSRTKKAAKATIKNLLNNPDSSVWIRRGMKDIVISKDSAGVVRAMTPYSINASGARRYAESINEYARLLAPDSVQVYSLLVPTQGEYYMPALTSTAGAEHSTIKIMAQALEPSVKAVLVNDTMLQHLDEEIYSRTDHHWSPLGAFYGSKAFAAVAGVPFRSLEDYTPRVIKDYVGTMYKFSGDEEVKKYPEEFVYFEPPKGYETEFINYSISGGKTVGEKEPTKGEFFKPLPDGSAAAYCVFMGGDYCTAKVTNTGGTAGRKLLLVKDSYGNAMASCLFGSFEEVHVIDFRYYPHNLPDYIRDNGITDLLFVNVISIGLSPAHAERLATMLEQN